jgi:hypothetical protein
MERDDSPLSDFDILHRANNNPQNFPKNATLSARPALASVYVTACHAIGFLVFFVSRKYFSMGEIFVCSWNFPLTPTGVCTCWLLHRLVPLLLPLIAVLSFVTLFAPVVRHFRARGQKEPASETGSPFPVDSSRASDTLYHEEIIYERPNLDQEIKSFASQAEKRKCVIGAGPDSMIRQIRHIAAMYADLDVYTETYQV